MAQEPLPDGVSSLLDTDLYKLTMQCAILKYFPDVRKLLLSENRAVDDLTFVYPDVTYGFTNRTPQMKLTRLAYKWLLAQMDSMLTHSIIGKAFELMRTVNLFRNREYPSFTGRDRVP